MLRIPALFALLFLLYSCSTTTSKKNSGLPGHFGEVGEVLIVMEDEFWDGSPGKTIREEIEKPYYLLPQYEQLFDFKHQTQDGFVKYLKNHRNVILANIGDKKDNQVANTRVINEQYARGQVIVEIRAKNAADWVKEFETKSAQIVQRIKDEELARIGKIMRSFHKNTLRDEVKKFIGVDVFLPTEFSIALGSDSIVHIPRSTGSSDRAIAKGIIIYTYPYESDSTFTPEFLIEKRNKVMAAHKIGSSPGSWMSTETIYPPMFSEMDFKGNYAMEMRGLWRLENDIGGGPFVSIAMLDEANNRIVTAEAYVYAPNTDKRELMREMEGALHAIELATPSAQSPASP